jgi:hypothetical protein
MSRYLAAHEVEPLTPPVVKPHETPNETPNATPPQASETYAQPTATCAKLAPVTKTELGKQFGVSRTSIGNWLAEIERIMSRCGVREPLATPDGLVSVFAQSELAHYREMGGQAYETDRLTRHGIPTEKASTAALVTTSSPLPIPFDWEDELDAIDDVEFVETTPIESSALLMVDSLQSEAENLHLALATVREQTNKLLQRDRRARRQNIAAMAKRDAVEDLTVYNTIYRDEMAKGGIA